ncbi:uncharacterized protein LOC116929664 isoform X2 [Daphnia magna]|uniref:uncharacterized protein LOC116929664 isoform X2 n=2 Tax=Daphnia magna TaxID=35525 RepID=UPI001402B049|nr:uncharacterized protein LOC116929664 isoform X2 [Daphnia magna]
MSSSSTSDKKSESESDVQVVGNGSGSVKRKLVKSAKSRKKRKPPTFFFSWLKLREFQPWLDHKFNSRKKIVTAYCKACNKHIQKHSERESHKAATLVFLAGEGERERAKQFFGKSESKKVLILTVRICAYIAENDFPLSLVDSFLALLKSMFPDDKVLSKVNLGRTKCSNIIRYGFGTYLTDALKKRLSETFWSLVIDETTDVSTVSQLAVMVHYWDKCKKRFIVEPFDLIDLIDGTAKGIISTLILDG